MNNLIQKTPSLIARLSKSLLFVLFHRVSYVFSKEKANSFLEVMLVKIHITKGLGMLVTSLSGSGKPYLSG